MRLTYSTNPFSGHVEIYANSTGGLHNAEWRSICDENWDILNARVVCHQLGYPDAVAALTSARYDQSTALILIENMQCLGNESDFFACAHSGISDHTCEHDQYAVVECTGLQPQHTTCIMYIRFSIGFINLMSTVLIL